VDLKEKEIK